MIRYFAAPLLLMTLTACGDGQPLFEDANVDEVDVFEELPPGTVNADIDESIQRFEERNDQGGGYAEATVYDPAADTFSVDNLAFDGFNTYQRSTGRPTIAGNGLYEADVTVIDTLTGGVVRQIVPYLAAVGISTNLTDEGEPRTEFAVIRSGGFLNYGFGGYSYSRSGGTTLPSTGQASFSGGYSGFRIYNKQAVLDIVEGDLDIRLDFDDFNANVGVAGEIRNRRITDLAGNPVTNLPTPTVFFLVVEGANALNEDGELAGQLQSTLGSSIYEDGVYFAIAAGDMTTLVDNGGELVGVVVMESKDPRFEDMTVQETGGFITYRD